METYNFVPLQKAMFHNYGTPQAANSLKGSPPKRVNLVMALRLGAKLLMSYNSGP